MHSLTRSILISILAFISCLNLNAQQAGLPLSETGKITFYEVVEVDSVKKEVLLNNAFQYLAGLHLPELNATHKKKKNPKKIDKKIAGLPIELDSAVGKVQSRYAFKVYKGEYAKHADGEISYNLTIEVKEGRYRYIFTNFIFQPYSLNRYGKYTAVSGIYKPLEGPPYEGNKNWNKHKLATEEKINGLITSLKLKMLEKPMSNIEVNKNQKPVVVDQVDW
ncbi:DUF4468 domain-containing protein [Flexithrix dorotheae]|uniref:DUF4468 domain-containing protein n=1 Tax=Flexithrix dorotheae TaxID=70993 RepID=UPI00037EA421|nr:DUF4468 domain-containing protein [Flexithrix dorotheae]